MANGDKLLFSSIDANDSMLAIKFYDLQKNNCYDLIRSMYLCHKFNVSSSKHEEITKYYMV